MTDRPILIETRQLSKIFEWRDPQRPWRRRPLKAVDRVDLAIEAGECLAIVGESGSGKTTFAQCLMLLQQVNAGSILFEGEDLARLTAAELKPYRARLQMVFQDASSAFNPRLRIREALAEPFRLNGIGKSEADQRVEALLQEVGLPMSAAERYPHQVSGGQRQRLGIIRGLALEPRLLALDEPVSALDVSVRAQILNWIVDLQGRYDLTTVIIAHDMAMVETIADRVAVFYFGRLIELAPTEQLFDEPQHPYTRGLLLSVPAMDPAQRGRKVGMGGEIPNPLSPPSGCVFHPRCPIAQERCRIEEPLLQDVTTGRRVACHFPGEWNDEDGWNGKH